MAYYRGRRTRVNRRRGLSKRYVRTMARRRRTGKSRMTAYTMFKGTGYSLPYRSRKLSARAFRKKIWNDTIAAPHWRSIDNNALTQTTGTTQGSGSVSLYTPLLSAAGGNPFWVTAGGLLPQDTGGASPTFRGDITLRGGKIGICISVAEASGNHSLIKVWTVRTVSNPIVARIISPQLLGWDPSVSPDFVSEFGRPIAYREAVINGNFSTFTVEHRLKPQKIDQASFINDFGHQIVFLVQIVNTVDATDNTVQVIPYHNVSFSADAAS